MTADNVHTRVLLDGERVVVLSPAGILVGDMVWNEALELGEVLISISESQVDRGHASLGMKRSVMWDHEDVTLFNGGQVGAVLTRPGAKAFGRALIIVARRAEEWVKREALARDAAILLRAGAPLGLTSNAAIQAEAAKIARDDRDLRRYLPGGIRGTEIVGEPTLIQGESR